MKVIGIDPGLADTGIGVVTGHGIKIYSHAFGVISTPKNIPMPDRLNLIFTGVLEVLENEDPDLMVVEDVFSLEKYPKSGITLGKVTGAILIAGFRTNVPITEIPVREAKKVLTGNGKASKAQLERSVRHMLNTDSPIKPFHASDALALAIIGLFRHSSKLTRI